MARMSGTETVATPARSQSRSLRTTIPVFVVEQLGLEEGVKIDWKLDKEGDMWMAIIKKRR